MKSQNDRYSRQILFDSIGTDGQSRLLASRVLIVGCGALGSAQAEALARAGVGRLRIADRDFVESSNLQRQTMFTESDASERLPKAIACASHIREINSEVTVDPEIVDVNHSNVERLISECDVVLDGTDNFSTRYLINDACVKHNVTWIYGAAVGSYGVTMTIRPSDGPCLRCVFPEPPPAVPLRGRAPDPLSCARLERASHILLRAIPSKAGTHLGNGHRLEPVLGPAEGRTRGPV